MIQFKYSTNLNRKKIALVTGANRGIGNEICRQLANKDIFVILTARDLKKGEAATKKIDSSGTRIVFYQLDVANVESIEQIKTFVEEKFGKLDILINNAAIYIDGSSSATSVNPDIVRQSFETNVMGPLMLCQAFIPLMRKNRFGRIVNISSGMGAFSSLGGGYAGYRISKTALNAMTKILAAEVAGKNISINSMCPGWVRTDMGGIAASRNVEKGAETAIWLALQPDGGPNGKFFRDKKEIPW